MKNTSHGAWFLGPKAEYHDVWEKFIVYIFRDHSHWRRNYFPDDSVVVSRAHIRENEQWVDSLSDELDKILAAFKSNNPNYSPRYLAHMVSEQTLPSVLGYLAGMLYNSNNVSGESSPVAVPMELEVGRMIATMLGYNSATSWTHITSGGTIANIEALWVARTVKFTPFMLREFCEINAIDFHITTPNGNDVSILDVDNRTMLALDSHQATFMTRHLMQHIVEQCGQTIEQAQIRIASHVLVSEYNVIRVGLYRILSRLGVEPVIFVSPSAHYSVKKAANILGYGECAVRTIDVDSSFRINVEMLRSALENLPDNEYVAAVIAISGTTEEGAIDPLHHIVELRGDLEARHNRSFWLHVDSAWGGYIRSLFCGYDVKVDDCPDMNQLALRYKEKINEHTLNSTDKVLWDNDEGVYKSMLSYPEADSITVDPHKLGYTPYPAGVVSFKNSVVTELIKQDAPYIFHNNDTAMYDRPPKITEIGSYILEGSKPGAAAASCYLAHKTVPLELEGHGKIIKATLQSTIKLAGLMNGHYVNFDSYAQKALEKMQMEGVKVSGRRFTTIPLHISDSNLICFVVRLVKDAANEQGWEVDSTMTAKSANELNEFIYHKMSIDHNQKLKATAMYDYFVSKTCFLDSVYGYDSLKPTLEMLKMSQAEYRSEGLFVLRTTVMNPFYPLAEQGDKDYLDQYVACLHANAEAVINNLNK